MHANDNDDEISTSTRGLCILYITLIARKLSKHDDGRSRPKHVVSVANKHHHFAIFIVVFLTEFTSPYSLNTMGMAHFRINKEIIYVKYRRKMLCERTNSFLGAFSKFRKATISFVIPVCSLSVLLSA